MPVPKHIRITLRGIFAGTPETWSTGCHFGSDVGVGSFDADAQDVDLEAVVTAWQGFLGAGGHIPNWAVLGDVRAYLIGTNGNMIGNPAVLDVSDRNIGGNAARFPPQIALVASLVANNRGPARKGRMYFPTGAALGADGRITELDALQIGEAVTGLLKDISNAIDVPLTLEGVSGINVSDRGGPDGTLQVIDHVEVGRVLDTMRSRRRSLIEEYAVGGHIDW